MDRRALRRQRSERAITDAIARLVNGNARYPGHVGIQVRLTKQAVAREAGVSSATLYRFPELVAKIDKISEKQVGQRQSASAQRLARLLEAIEEYKRREAALIAENLRLTRLLVKYDSSLGLERPVDLGRERLRRRRSRL